MPDPRETGEVTVEVAEVDEDEEAVEVAVVEMLLLRDSSCLFTASARTPLMKTWVRRLGSTEL